MGFLWGQTISVFILSPVGLGPMLLLGHVSVGPHVYTGCTHFWNLAESVSYNKVTLLSFNIGDTVTRDKVHQQSTDCLCNNAITQCFLGSQ